MKKSITCAKKMHILKNSIYKSTKNSWKWLRQFKVVRIRTWSIVCGKFLTPMSSPLIRKPILNNPRDFVYSFNYSIRELFIRKSLAWYHLLSKDSLFLFHFDEIGFTITDSFRVFHFCVFFLFQSAFGFWTFQSIALTYFMNV